MANTFGDLTYNQKTLKPIGRPVDDLKDLYAKKGEDYNYVIDSLNATETALNAIPYEDKDKAIVDAAKTKYQDTFKSFAEEGDFENRKVDTKNLANAMANRYGLKQVQTNSMARTAMIGDLKKRLEEGKITREVFNNAVRDSDRNYGGVQKDETTGEYLGNYVPTQVQDTVNIPKELLTVLDGFKANKIILTDPKTGRTLLPTANGYLKEGTTEYVSEGELEQAAIAYMNTNDNIKSQIRENLMFEKNNLLYDEEGNKRELNAEDLKQIITRSNPEDPSISALGITPQNLENIEEVLQEQGYTLEQAYDVIRKNQIMQEATVPSILKYGYRKDTNTYKKDWLMEFNAKQSAITTPSPSAILTPVTSKQRYSSEDLKLASTQYTNSVNSLASNEARYNTLVDRSTGKVKPGASPKEVADLTLKIKEDKEIIANMENRGNTLLKNNPEVSKLISDTVKGGTFIREADSKSVRNTSVGEGYTFTIDGIDINETSMQRLIWRNMDGNLLDADINKHINLDVNKYMEEERVKLTQEMSEIQESTDRAIVGTKAFEEEVTRRGTEAHRKAVETEGRKLKNRVEYISNLVTEKADKGDVAYTTDSYTVNLPEMAAKDERADEIFQLNNHVAKLPGTTAGWMNEFTSSWEGETIAGHLARQYGIDDEEGNIDWDNAKMQTTIGVTKDKNGVYSPTIMMSVPVRDTNIAGDSDKNPKYKLVDVAVKSTNGSYNKKYIESMNDYRQKLTTKRDTYGLRSSEQDILDQLNLSMYNLSDYAKNIDNAGLYDGVEGTKTIKWWEGKSANVTVFNGNSPGDFGYLLTEGEGEDMKYWGSADDVNIQLYTAEEIANPYSGITPLGANSVEDLKTVFGTLVEVRGLDKNRPKEVLPSKSAIIDEYFGGAGIPKSKQEVLTKTNDPNHYVNKISEMSKEEQDIIGIQITDLGNNQIEIIRL